MKPALAIQSNQMSLNTVPNSPLISAFFAAAIEYNRRIPGAESPAMPRPNFCVECGERLALLSWRARLRGNFCNVCAHRLRHSGLLRTLVVLAATAFLTFALGRWLRPAPPPLIIQRAANSPLSDLPVDPTSRSKSAGQKENGPAKQSINSEPVDDVVYLCGARTQKGTPCRRRVHFAGERCYQHKGMPAMVPLEKLTVKNK
jgi:hypothetical protein